MGKKEYLPGDKAESRPAASIGSLDYRATRPSSRLNHHPKSNTPDLFMDVSTDLLGRGKSVLFRAPGRSMQPTIKPNETILVKPVTPSAVEVGDIILYRWEEGVIAHRVVRIERERGDVARFILRGDASTTCDAPVEARQILGKVVSVKRRGRAIDLYGRRADIVRFALAMASRPRRRMIQCLRRLVGRLPGNR